MPSCCHGLDQLAHLPWSPTLLPSSPRVLNVPLALLHCCYCNLFSPHDSQKGIKAHFSPPPPLLHASPQQNGVGGRKQRSCFSPIPGWGSQERSAESRAMPTPGSSLPPPHGLIQNSELGMPVIHSYCLHPRSSCILAYVRNPSLESHSPPTPFSSSHHLHAGDFLISSSQAAPHLHPPPQGERPGFMEWGSSKGVGEEAWSPPVWS